MGQTGVIKIADLVLLPYISFIIAFRPLESIEREYESTHSLHSQSDLLRFSVFAFDLL